MSIKYVCFSVLLSNDIERRRTWFSFGRIRLFLLLAFRDSQFVVRIFFIVVVKDDYSFSLPFHDICRAVVLVVGLEDWLRRILEEFLTLNSQCIGPIVDASRFYYVFILIKQRRIFNIHNNVFDSGSN